MSANENPLASHDLPNVEEIVSPPSINPPAEGNHHFYTKKPWSVFFLLVFLVVSGYLVYGVSRFSGGTTVSPLGKNSLGSSSAGLLEIAPNEQKTIENPLNGVLYTPSQAKLWQSRRPMAVMINNHITARPGHAGLAAADIVYEANAEGGIPRLMPVFLSQTPGKVGSVRSVRVYFVDLAKEVDAWLAHWGGAQIDPNDPTAADPAADAYSRMRNIFVSSLDETRLGEEAFWREEQPGLAIEHTGYTSVPKLYAAAYRLYPDQRRELKPAAPWMFKEDAPLEERPEAAEIIFNFWDFADYEVRWEYSRADNVYKRFQGGQPHKDSAAGETLAAKNVILEYIREASFKDQKKHLNYNALGSGRAQVLRDGKVIEAVWRRRFPEERTRYFEKETGEELIFNRGQIWIEIIPEGNQVTLAP